MLFRSHIRNCGYASIFANSVRVVCSVCAKRIINVGTALLRHAPPIMDTEYFIEYPSIPQNTSEGHSDGANVIKDQQIIYSHSSMQPIKSITVAATFIHNWPRTVQDSVKANYYYEIGSHISSFARSMNEFSTLAQRVVNVGKSTCVAGYDSGPGARTPSTLFISVNQYSIDIIRVNYFEPDEYGNTAYRSINYQEIPSFLIKVKCGI